MFNTIQLEYHQNIAFVILNRPQKKNAMNFTMMSELITAAKLLQHNKSIRAVIIAGNQHTFCSGIDLQDFNRPNATRFFFWQLLKPNQSLFQKAALIWRNLPIPVIAVVDGFCVGAGLQLALAADFRYVYPNTKFSFLESKWGIIPDMGFAQTAMQLIAQDKLRKLVYTAAFFDSSEALSLNLVSHVSNQALEDALAFVEELENRSPDAITAAKNIINTAVIQPKKALRKEKIWQLKLLIGRNQKIAVKKAKNPKLVYQPRQYK